MTFMPFLERVPSPIHPPTDLLDHEAECRSVLAPLVDRLLERVEAAGWSRRTAATAMMFLAAAHCAAASKGASR